MNVLFINYARGRGGGEEFLRDLLPGLAAQGVKVGLVCRPGTPLTRMFGQPGVSLYPMERSGLRGVKTVFELANIIRNGGYGVISIQRSHDILLAWIAATLSHTAPRLTYTVQVAEFLRSRWMLGRMDRIVTISRHIRDKLIAFSPSLGSKTDIIYYGIDLDRFTVRSSRSVKLRTRFGLPSNARIIGTVGDLWKNQIEFLDALVLIRDQLPGTRFLLVASENESESLRSFKRRVQVLDLGDAVLWAGRLSKDEMRECYSELDIAVSSHRNEGFGIWVLEALAMGTPVVAVNEGGIRDPLDGCPAGVLVDGGPREMADAVIGILKQDERRAAMAAAGPGWVRERFSMERMITDYHAFYSQLQDQVTTAAVSR